MIVLLVIIAAALWIIHWAVALQHECSMQIMADQYYRQQATEHYYIQLVANLEHELHKADMKAAYRGVLLEALKRCRYNCDNHTIINSTTKHEQDSINPCNHRDDSLDTPLLR